MKKTFSRWIQTLTTALTSEISAKTKPSKRGKNSSAPKSKKLALEHLEDRCLLTASSITFNQLQDFTYQPSGAAFSFGLERTHFLEVAKISSRGNDIVSIDRDLHTVSVFLNQGGSANQYGTPVKTAISGVSGSSKKYALADMNNDGVADLLVLYPKQVTVSGRTQTDLCVDVYQGAANGSFSTTCVTTQIANPFNYTGTDNDLGIESIQLRNVVGDSYPDLLVTLKGTSWSGSNKVEKTESFLYVGKDKGVVTTAITVPASVTGDAVGFANVTSNASSLQLISQTETITSGRSAQTLYFYNTTVTSSAFTATTAAGRREYAAATPLWTKIANVDQRPGDEIITGIQYIDSYNQPKYGVRVSSVTSGLPTGIADIPMSISTIDVEIEPRYSAIGDMNNDGYIDILVSDGTSYQFLAGSSTGQFHVQSKIDSFANYLAVQSGDFDGDGYQDIVAIGEKHVMFLPGNPSHPSYNTGQVLLTLTAKATHAVFGDFHGNDGYIDFVVAQGDAGTTLTLYTGQAPGNSNLFKKFMTITEANSPSVLATGNFMTKKIVGTTNPKTDLAVLHNGGTDVLVISFEGAQATTKNMMLSAAVVHMAAGDFNNDGYDDLIFVNEDTANVTILKNKGLGDGTFNLADPTSISVGTPLNVTTQVGSRPCFVAVADIDGRNGLDFAVLNAGDKEVRFYTQSATGTFASGPTASLNNLNLKTSVRNYQMIFEDFDLDRRVDLLVGVTGTNQAVVFQNKGTQSGQFSSDSNWVGTQLVLDGSLNNKTVFAMSTGFKTGSKTSSGYAAKTPGIALVSGNKIYRFENTTPSEVSPGSMEIVFREYQGTVLSLDSAQYDAVPTAGSLTWLHEWGHYYLEVWGSSGSVTESISSFACTLNYDKSLFSVTSVGIQTVDSNFALNSTAVNASTGQIVVSGTSKVSLGRDKYVLLFRIFVSPAANTSSTTTENVGVPIPRSGYATPVASGFLFDSGTAKINTKDIVNLTDGRVMPVYPVIYDVNDTGLVDPNDFGSLSQQWGRTTIGDDGIATIATRVDFNHSGRVEQVDFTNFTRAYMKKRGDIFLHSLFPSGFPALWPQLPSASLPEPSADLMDVFTPSDTFSPFSTAQEFDTVLIGMSDSYTTADILATENECVDTKSVSFNFSAVSFFESASATFLSVSELDTLGYVARTESIFNSERKRIETLDQVLGELFQEENEAWIPEEFCRITDQPFESLQLNDQVLTELI